jgi:serine/threonine protein kinase
MPTAVVHAELSERQLRAACGELDRLLRGGERVRAERFFALYPLLAAHEDFAVELLYTEFAAREEAGQRPTPEEFYARFPQWKERLQRQFQIHQLLRDSLDGEAEGGPLAPAGGPPAPPEPAPPGRLGQYKLLEEVARGSCGVVFKAWQDGLDRVVAVKVLLPAFARRRRARRRFWHEARVMASLRHPHIMPVHEVGESRGVIYFSMDYMPAGSLADRLRAGAGREVLPLLEAVARAVDHAHRQGVVHCDLKPSNVLLDAQGAPVVSDFGLARLPADAAGPDGPGRIIGTPAYMAPEQMSGDSPPTPAADVWALGVMLYEALAGRRPFGGATLADLQHALSHEEPLPLEQLCPEVGPGLGEVCRRCLAKDPARRYPSAAEFADELRRWHAH